jgi:hypothetical protein
MTQAMQMRERGLLLSAWLVFVALANAWTLYRLIVTIEDLLTHSDPRWERIGWALVMSAIGCVLNFVAVLALWRWKRWGLYLFIAVALVGVVINLILGVPLVTTLIGVVGVVILIVLVQSRWANFD